MRDYVEIFAISLFERSAWLGLHKQSHGPLFKRGHTKDSGERSRYEGPCHKSDVPCCIKYWLALICPFGSGVSWLQLLSHNIRRDVGETLQHVVEEWDFSTAYWEDDRMDNWDISDEELDWDLPVDDDDVGSMDDAHNERIIDDARIANVNISHEVILVDDIGERETDDCILLGDDDCMIIEDA